MAVIVQLNTEAHRMRLPWMLSANRKASSACCMAMADDNGTTISLMPGDALSDKELPSFLEVRDSPGRGLGVFALVDIPVGVRICEYEGERLDRKQVRQKELRTFGNDSVNEYLFQVGNDLVIDGMSSEHPSRYINHAERGNLETLIYADTDHRPAGAVFHTTRAISAGDELLYDYGLQYWARRGIDPIDDTRVAELSSLRITGRIVYGAEAVLWALPTILVAWASDLISTGAVSLPDLFINS